MRKGPVKPALPESPIEAVHRIWGDPYQVERRRHEACSSCTCASRDPQALTLAQLSTRDLLVEMWPLGVDLALERVESFLEVLAACDSRAFESAAEKGIGRPSGWPEWFWRMPVPMARFTAMDVQFKLKNYKVQVDLHKLPGYRSGPRV